MSNVRNIQTTVQGYTTVDGAGVKLVRVLGGETIKDFNPILMLDSFDSTNPDEYTAGFPMHPHRGIETISYVYKGGMVHRDSLGNEAAVHSGEVQWMTAGSGIMHEELVPAAERLLGVQLWLNLPKEHKMANPAYHPVTNDMIEDIEIDGGYLRLLAGTYHDHVGHKSSYLPLNYYDVHLENERTFTHTVKADASIMLFTLIGDIEINGTVVKEKTAVKLTAGDTVTFTAKSDDTQVLYIESIAIDEPVAWAGPIVMNTQDELREAFRELQNGTFVKAKMDVE
ncbi:pirin family protein [Veillonella caviae]|uniref:pirin family protein n=1 Tax=Veillonella caviae TaxID=248316 RepID=UPI002A909CC3|nr:pirin family protein [Veillonella caviae]MDY5787611.1 pirin family protein [Veillonella caviae]